MDTKPGAGQFDPSVGRDAELQAIAASDLPMEALMAGGADVDALIEAGVVDDREENSDLLVWEEIPPDAGKYKGGPPMTERRHQELLAMFDKNW